MRTVRSHRPLATWLVTSTALSTMALALSGVGDARANPRGGSVVAGDARIVDQGGGRLRIEQRSNRAAIDWKSFDIGRDEHTHFAQPGRDAVALNRVTKGSASTIAGRLSADGKVILLNPAGVLFTKDSKVDVAGIVASTARLDNHDFMAGRLDFQGSGTGGKVVNEGEITVRGGGLAALVAPEVKNAGTITARLGKVALGAGEAFTVDLYGDGLVQLAVSEADVRGVTQNGTIDAEGGLVQLSVAEAARILDRVVSVSGTTRAESLAGQEGRIHVDAGQGGRVEIAGTLDASAATAGAQGGEIAVAARTVEVKGGARLDASGPAGGGEVKVGAAFHGAPAIPRAKPAAMVTVAQGASLRADATVRGDGGTVVAYAAGTTVFHGSASAKGGPEGGDGGLIETSGLGRLDVGHALIDASATRGAPGEWLLDPFRIVITNDPGGDEDATFVNAADLAGLLASGTSVTIQSTAEPIAPDGVDVFDPVRVDRGSITVESGIFVSGGDGNATLTLRSDGFIRVNDTIDVRAGRDTAINVSLEADGDIFANARIVADGDIGLASRNDIVIASSAIVAGRTAQLTADSDRSGAGAILGEVGICCEGEEANAFVAGAEVVLIAATGIRGIVFNDDDLAVAAADVPSLYVSTPRLTINNRADGDVAVEIGDDGPRTTTVALTHGGEGQITLVEEDGRGDATVVTTLAAPRADVALVNEGGRVDLGDVGNGSGGPGAAASLDVTAAEIVLGDVTTTGNQSYDGPAFVDGAVTLTARQGEVGFENGVGGTTAGQDRLTVNAPGGTIEFASDPEEGISLQDLALDGQVLLLRDINVTGTFVGRAREDIAVGVVVAGTAARLTADADDDGDGVIAPLRRSPGAVGAPAIELAAATGITATVVPGFGTETGVGSLDVLNTADGNVALDLFGDDTVVTAALAHNGSGRVTVADRTGGIDRLAVTRLDGAEADIVLQLRDDDSPSGEIDLSALTAGTARSLTAEGTRIALGTIATIADQTYDGPALVDGAVTLTTDTGAISLARTVSGTPGSPDDLTLVAQNGSVTLDGAATSITGLRDLTADAVTLTLNGITVAGTLTGRAREDIAVGRIGGGDAVVLAADSDGNGSGAISAFAGPALAFLAKAVAPSDSSARLDTPTATLSAAEGIGSARNPILLSHGESGPISVTAINTRTGPINLGFLTTGPAIADITQSGAGPVDLDANGALRIAGLEAPGSNVTLRTERTLDFAPGVAPGVGRPLGSLTASAAEMTLPGIGTTGDQTYDADPIRLTGIYTTGGGDFTASGPVVLAGGADGVTVDSRGRETGPGGNVSFAQTIDGPGQDMTVRTGGGRIVFIGSVGADGELDTVILDAGGAPPPLTVNPAVGDEDTPIPLEVTFNATVPGQPALVISGLPPGSILTDGTNTFAATPGSDSVDVVTWDLARLTFQGPPDVGQVFDLSAMATAFDPARVSLPQVFRARVLLGAAAATVPFQVEVQPVADTPSLEVDSAEGIAGSEVPLSIDGEVADMDGSERLFFLIENVPDDAELSAGQDLGNGVWQVPQEQIEGLRLIVPADRTQNIDLQVTAVAFEQARPESTAASDTAALAVDIAPVQQVIPPSSDPSVAAIIHEPGYPTFVRNAEPGRFPDLSPVVEEEETTKELEARLDMINARIAAMLGPTGEGVVDPELLAEQTAVERELAQRYEEFEACPTKIRVSLAWQNTAADSAFKIDPANIPYSVDVFCSGYQVAGPARGGRVESYRGLTFFTLDYWRDQRQARVIELTPPLLRAYGLLPASAGEPR